MYLALPRTGSFQEQQAGELQTAPDRIFKPVAQPGCCEARCPRTAATTHAVARRKAGLRIPVEGRACSSCLSTQMGKGNRHRVPGHFNARLIPEDV